MSRSIKSNIVLSLESVTKNLGNKVILHNVSLTLYSGEILSLIGPNGAGKSSIIKIALGIWKPDKGKVKLFSITPQEFVNSPLTMKIKVGFALQDPELWHSLTVSETLTYIASLYGMRGNELRDKVEYLMDAFGLSDHRGKLVKQLSGGLRKRLQLAIAFISDPDLVILDEPTQGLDIDGRRILSKILKKFVSQGKAVLIATHDLKFAEEISTRVALIHKGRVVDCDYTNGILRKYCGNGVIHLVVDESTKDIRKILEGLGLSYVKHDNEYLIVMDSSSSPSRIITELEALNPSSISVHKPNLIDAYTIAIHLSRDKNEVN